MSFAQAPRQLINFVDNSIRRLALPIGFLALDSAASLFELKLLVSWLCNPFNAND
ncbi:11020_t:CDS:2 [Entrophospora sp. SA101]|nr:11020_t:CDS:2 [Entrophospora sp. SA101]